MKNAIGSFGIFLLLLVAANAPGQSSPVLGLTLSGGGAKGLAHIGVLKVLEENGIYPDLVTGTSMGSSVGGLYSIGYTPAELEKLATSLRWADYFNDTYPRGFLPVEEKARADRYQLSFALVDGKLRLPRGLIRGKKIQTLLAGLTVPVNGETDFDRFYLPFRCVATDLENGRAVVFRDGPLRRAIRASMSIPSAFEPVEFQGRLLVDGLLARNLPVQDALDMGAGVVVGVDVGDPLYSKEELSSVLAVLEQTSSFGAAASTYRQRQLADFLIDPDLEGYSTLSYDRADSLIARGEAAARSALPALRARLDSLGVALPRESKPRPPLQRDSFYVTSVSFDGDKRATTRTLSQLFHARLPRVFTLEQLSDEVGRLYGAGFFDLVDFELLPVTGGYHLVLHANSGPAWFLRGSINYDADYNAGLLLNLTGRNMGLRGSIVSADVRVSANPAAFLDYLVYTRSNPGFGLKMTGMVNFFPGRLYSDNRLLSEFKMHHFSGQTSFLAGFGRQWAMELGLLGERFSQSPRFFASENNIEAVMDQGAAFFSVSRDTYDRSYFPTSGSLATAYAQWTLAGRIRERSGEARTLNIADNIMLTGRIHKVFPLGRHLWLNWFNGAGLINYRQHNFINLLYLGRDLPGEERFFEVYGLNFMEQPATGFAYSGLLLRSEIGQQNFVGLAYNFLWYAQSDYAFVSEEIVVNRDYTSGRLHGLALELGSLTPLGPLRFTAEYNIGLGRLNFTFWAGYRF